MRAVYLGGPPGIKFTSNLSNPDGGDIEFMKILQTKLDFTLSYTPSFEFDAIIEHVTEICPSLEAMLLSIFFY